MGGGRLGWVEFLEERPVLGHESKPHFAANKEIRWIMTKIHQTFKYKRFPLKLVLWNHPILPDSVLFYQILAN